MQCEIHGSEMEWVENEAHPEGGFWHCESCQEEEEAGFSEEEEWFAWYEDQSRELEVGNGKN